MNGSKRRRRRRKRRRWRDPFPLKERGKEGGWLVLLFLYFCFSVSLIGYIAEPLALSLDGARVPEEACNCLAKDRMRLVRFALKS